MKLLKTHVTYLLIIKLTGMTKRVVTLTWGGDNCSTVEISGLDIGWGQVITFFNPCSRLLMFDIASNCDFN